MKELQALALLHSDGAYHTLTAQAFRAGQDYSMVSILMAGFDIWDHLAKDPSPRSKHSIREMHPRRIGQNGRWLKPVRVFCRRFDTHCRRARESYGGDLLRSLLGKVTRTPYPYFDH